MADIEYSIIVPVYNGSSTLIELVGRIQKVMEAFKAELILVDDGSQDDTWAVILGLITRQNNWSVRGIRLKMNSGQQHATMCGLRAATGQSVITIDDDLQVPPEEISRLTAHMQSRKADVVYGVYQDQQQGLIRNMFRLMVYRLLNMLGYGHLEHSSFRLINRQTLDGLVRHNSFLVSVDEILRWYTGNITHVTVSHLPRRTGRSNYTFLKLVKVTLKVLFGYYSIPLKFIVGLGFYISLASFLLGMMFLFKKIFFNVEVEGWTSLMVSLMFSSGVITFSLGLIGKYLLHLITLLNDKPGYSIAETVG